MIFKKIFDCDGYNLYFELHTIFKAIQNRIHTYDKRNNNN